jgi:hypothetical protein
MISPISLIHGNFARITFQTAMETTSEPWVRHIKWRFVGFFLIAGAVIALPVYAWIWSHREEDIVVFDTYKQVSLKALCGIAFDPVNGKITDIPQRFRDLETQRVKLAGFMLVPGARHYTNIKSFDLYYADPKTDSPNLPVQSHIHCVAQGENELRYLSGPVTVWGFLHCDIHRDATTHEVTSIYQLECKSASPEKE